MLVSKLFSICFKYFAITNKNDISPISYSSYTPTYKGVALTSKLHLGAQLLVWREAQRSASGPGPGEAIPTTAKSFFPESPSSTCLRTCPCGPGSAPGQLLLPPWLAARLCRTRARPAAEPGQGPRGPPLSALQRLSSGDTAPLPGTSAWPVSCDINFSKELPIDIDMRPSDQHPVTPAFLRI